jgi:hypothetical protein
MNCEEEEERGVHISEFLRNKRLRPRRRHHCNVVFGNLDNPGGEEGENKIEKKRNE